MAHRCRPQSVGALIMPSARFSSSAMRVEPNDIITLLGAMPKRNFVR
jgi:hypothetical protein